MSISRANLLKMYSEKKSDEEKIIEQKKDLIKKYSPDSDLSLSIKKNDKKPSTLGDVIKIFLENKADKITISKNKKETISELKNYFKEKYFDSIKLNN